LKSARNNKIKANDVSVISKGKENERWETLAKHCNARKWAKAKKGLVNGSPWCMPTKE
jgi:hypothetical protein